MTKKHHEDKDHKEEPVEEKIEVEEAQALRDVAVEWENKYKRALADYQNLEKRVRDERYDWVQSANREILLRLLPVLDTLMLAQQHVQDEGLRVSIQQFLDTLKAEGVERIETVGKEFDPHLMEAIGTGDGEEDKVVEEVQTGYMMHGKLLRPARVKVGKENKE